MRSRFPLVAIGLILLVTAAWWALALWPLPAAAPVWLARTRAVCFGATHDGLPSAAGWIALLLEPIALIAAVGVVWGEPLREGLRRLWGGRAGRAVLLATALSVVAGISLAGARVISVQFAGERFDPSGGAVRRRVGPAPALTLIDQGGSRFDWARLGGRPAVVAFAYAHCATVCPTLVNDLHRARGGSGTPALVLVTLDPRRDTPARLAAIAREWRLGEGDFLLGGDVGEVERALAVWGVPWRRDSLTGEIAHGTQLFAVGPEGQLIWEVGGGDARTAVRLAAGWSGGQGVGLTP